MKVAVVGAGFAGLAAAWFLLKKQVDVKIFDSLEIGEGTSGIAAGLLYPYSGAHSKLNWMGHEGMAATMSLVEVAETFLGKSVILSRGLFRPALTEAQQRAFFTASQKYPDIQWCSADEAALLVPGISPFPGLIIPSAVSLNCRDYLQGLFQACVENGAGFEKGAIPSATVLLREGKFDRVLFCTGAHTVNINGLDKCLLTVNKGQLLTMSWPEAVSPLTMNVCSKKYICMDGTGKYCHVGSTYERDYLSAGPDLERAKSEILPELDALCPSLDASRIVDCRAGFRATTPDRKPLVARVQENVWIFAGLGSKGLLHHALFAETVAGMIANN